MRKREHAGFVTLVRLMSPPDRVKSGITYKEDIEREKCQTVRVCGVVGVMSDGMLTQGI